ncbi:CTD kinase subunit gamma CTK3-domain-containing protein [Phlebopus sp. FC_14]|nr:CTD kinase subunit gamma CTK3-domain-containing protein [Phlebopus sp. FC_14]
MDPFEVRMQFLGLLRKLNAKQESIQRVVGYALKYFSRCGEDLWECVVEECQKGSINHRINILYFLDSLCESSLLAKAHQPPPPPSESSSKKKPNRQAKRTVTTSFYVDYVSRDLAQIIEYVVPVGRLGLPNLTSTKQILENWRTKRVIDPQRVDEVMHILFTRQSQATDPSSAAPPSSSSSSSTTIHVPSNHKGGDTHLSRGEIFKRIEEDRERHKRLRERRWVQAQAQAQAPFQPTHPSSTSTPSTSSQVPSYNPYSLASFLPLSDTENTDLALDIEFENEWEATSEWNEDDVEAVVEEKELCFPYLRKKGEGEEGGGEEPMDLS